MTTIGTFSKSANGFTGAMRTLTLDIKVKLVAVRKLNASAPDYRLQAGDYEIGAAWNKVSKSERPYLSVTLDDPSFPRTVYASLVESEDGSSSLIWSRGKKA